MKQTNEQIISHAVEKLMTMLKTGNMPEQVAFSIIHRHSGDIIPSDHWSLGNRILQIVQGTEDARGYNQWKEAGRQVNRGAHAIHILAPITIKVKEINKDTGEESERVFVKGYHPIPVFRYEDTSGRDLPYDHTYQPVNPPNFMDVAEKLGIKVDYKPLKANYLGRFNLKDNSIKLCAKDSIVYFHELAHAIHSTMVDLQTFNRAKAEVIAEFSALVLANICNIKGYEKQGFDYIQNYSKAHTPANTLQEIMSILNDVDKVVSKILDVSDEELPEQFAI